MTYCGQNVQGLDTTRDDRQTTCRKCLKFMGRRERMRLEWEKQ